MFYSLNQYCLSPLFREILEENDNLDDPIHRYIDIFWIDKFLKEYLFYTRNIKIDHYDYWLERLWAFVEE